MNILDFEKALNRYLARQVAYKKSGCDPQGESWFVIEKALPLDGAILEVGSGQGYFARNLAERGYHLTGVDPCADDIAIARWNLERAGVSSMVDLKVAGGERLPFSDHVFDVIFSVKVLHHLQSPFKVIDEMLRVVSPAGKIVISDFSEDGFSLVEKIHQMEGETHPRLGVPLFDVKKYLLGKDCAVEHERTRWQETLIAYAP
jgi:ubiquinone/menaquinone biosynthesis C-methylase UbiE